MFSRPLLANSSYPLVPNLEVDVLLCYMETGDDRKLNLVTLCDVQPEAASSIQACIQNANTAKMPVRKVSYDGKSLVG